MKFTRMTGVICVILLLILNACKTTAEETSLPELAPEPSPSSLVIDGTINPGEWSGMDHFELTGGSNLYLTRIGETFYLAIESSQTGMLGANIFMYQQDQIRIMHISAALGTAEYAWDGENWYLVRNFDWQHRSVGNGETALAERQVYQSAEGWSAPNARTGTANHLELQIIIDQGPTRIAVNPFQSGSQNIGVWPGDLGDDTGIAFADGLPDILSLEPENWFLIP